MGRVGGLTRGRDGNMHMGDMSRRIIAIISAMAASVPVAAGAALALKYKGTQQRRLLLFRRRRHQPRRLARRPQPRRRPEAARGLRLQQQPVRLFDAARQADGLRQRGGPRARATAFRRRSWTATTYSPCYEAARRAVEHARAGNGPYLIECKTFRMTGHSAHDAADYVPAGIA